IGTASPQTVLDVNGGAQIGSGVTKSTFSTAGALTLAANAALNLSGATGNIISKSSITTSGAFFGDGSHLTFSAAGTSLNVNNSTFTASASGIVSAPSQPGAAVCMTADRTALGNGATSLSWDSASSASTNYNKQGVWGGTASSTTFVVPADGYYYLNACVTITATSLTDFRLYWGGSAALSNYFGPGTVTNKTYCVSGMQFLSAGGTPHVDFFSDV